MLFSCCLAKKDYFLLFLKLLRKFEQNKVSSERPKQLYSNFFFPFGHLENVFNANPINLKMESIFNSYLIQSKCSRTCKKEQVCFPFVRCLQTKKCVDSSTHWMDP